MLAGSHECWRTEGSDPRLFDADRSCRHTGASISSYASISPEDSSTYEWHFTRLALKVIGQTPDEALQVCVSLEYIIISHASHSPDMFAGAPRPATERTSVSTLSSTPHSAALHPLCICTNCNVTKCICVSCTMFGRIRSRNARNSFSLQAAAEFALILFPVKFPFSCRRKSYFPGQCYKPRIRCSLLLFFMFLHSHKSQKPK